jgi:hypothetical protein
MRLGLQQPYFFPHLDYYRLVFAVDRFIAYDDAAWIKGGWIHRNKVLVNGRPAWVTIPTARVRLGTPIHAVETHAGPWRRTILRTIVQAYARAPYQEPVLALARGVLELPSPYVADLAIASLEVVRDYLGYSTPILRARGRYDTVLAGQDRVVAICRAEGATEYLNAIGGRALYDRATFQRAGVSLRFVSGRTEAAAAPADVRLSILDTLMHHSIDDVRAMVAAYDLL